MYPRACQITQILKFFGLSQKFDTSGFFFSKFKISIEKQIVAGGINGLSINKDFDEKKKIQKFKIFMSKMG